MLLCSICHENHYYVLVINLANNEGYVIDGLNYNQTYAAQKQTYMHRVLASPVLCQKLQIKDFNFNVPSSFNIQNFKLKSCSIPTQSDVQSWKTCQQFLQ